MAQFNLSTICLLLLLSLSLFAVQANTACCTTYSHSELELKYIKGFSIQDNRGRCHINAVIFHTIKGRKVCADPTKDWVIERIQQLRNKVQKMTKN
ncbi:C-C motif chemokine 20a.3 [Anguilla rostrata]|uniref:C-C motif chemokine 20-like n=1 Tax=Anguilla anguilla TaxID=7936 RepID=UPI0015A76A9F|nr:C-C motif chemokine 20-like [Anguilla anguilla]